MKITDRQFIYHNSASHSDLHEFRERMADRQRIADREWRDREQAEERAYDVTRELINRSR